MGLFNTGRKSKTVTIDGQDLTIHEVTVATLIKLGKLRIEGDLGSFMLEAILASLDPKHGITREQLLEVPVSKHHEYLKLWDEVAQLSELLPTNDDDKGAEKKANA